MKFCLNEKDQEVHENYVNGFSGKIIIWGKSAIFGLKMVHPHNFGSALSFFLKFCIMKWAERYMEILLMVFLRKISFAQVGFFGPENGASS